MICTEKETGLQTLLQSDKTALDYFINMPESAKVKAWEEAECIDTLEALKEINMTM